MDLNTYIFLFPGVTREKPRFMALAQAVLAQAADLMALVAGMPEAYSLGFAVGKQLDCLAAALGLTKYSYLHPSYSNNLKLIVHSKQLPV